MKSSRFIPAALVLVGCVIHAQQPVCRPTVMVTAFDPKTNAPIDGLTAGDLQAKMMGRAMAIHSLAPLPTARRFIFVLDRSGSMVGVRGAPDSVPAYSLDRLMKQVLEQSLGEIPSGDSVAFLAFSGGRSKQTEFLNPATARSELPDILAWHPGKGLGGHRTPLWASIETALQMLSPHQAGDVIVALSDGIDNMSKLSKDRIQNDLLASGVPILAMIIANPYQRALDSEDGLRDFAGLAESTGGASALADERLAGDLTFRVSFFQPDQLIPLFAHQYQLELETPAIQKPEKWELKANSVAGNKLDLLYPRYLTACAEAH